MTTEQHLSGRVVLEVSDLQAGFDTERGFDRVVDGVSFEARSGSILGIVGESGSGKSVTALSILRLVEPPGRIVGGQIRLHGRDLLALQAGEMNALRGNQVAMVFQDPMSSLNPVLRIGTQMVEAIRAHSAISRGHARAMACEALARVGIAAPEQRLRAYPHELSGGMRQRVVIAIALLNSPDVLIADEATTALDVTVQAQILDVVRRLARDQGLAVVWITHDVELVAGLADELCVMQSGQIVERGTVDAVLDAPRHPYTQTLLEAVAGRSLA
jgi:peptide/nickel transport system ATP-binding protein